LTTLSRDGWLLFATRMVRLFAYGFLAVVLGLYLAEVGLSDPQIGLLLSLTLLGDALISLPITIIADRVGRRRMLMVGAGLMILAGVVFALTGNILLLTITAIIGTISPSGNEVGPFLAIEQAALPQTTTDKQRTQVFAWYSLVGALMTGLGSLVGGSLAQALQAGGSTALDSYRAVIIGYALLGAVLLLIFGRMSPAVEVAEVKPAPTLSSLFGLHRSRKIVFRLSLLFMLDAFAGGFIVQSLMALWFNRRFGVDTAVIGSIFLGANLFAGLSALAAARVAARFGLINTMVFTHAPSNLLLILVPLMPTLPLAVLVLGLAWLLASLGVFLRNVGQTIGFVTTVLLFLAPVFYPITALPEAVRPWLLANPLTFIIEQAREVLIWGRAPDWAGLGVYAVVAAAVAWAGYAWFQKTRKGFADVL